jgi:hypothetical protein
MGTGPDFQGDFDITRFEPAGPVCKAFIESNGPFDFIRGPWGSGKTVSAVFKIAQKAGTLFPVCKDGKINVRCAAVRETYRELAKTALPTWLRFFPKYGPYTAKEKDAYSGGQDRPVNHILEWDVLRKWPTGWKETTVRLEMQFGAIGTDNLESFFKGYEISYGWLNECDTMHEDVPGLLFGRTGRFPPRDTIMEWEGERLGYEEDPDTGLKVIKIPRMVFGDFNPPDEVNWTYKREIEEPEKWPGYNFFAQPSGLSANAENRKRKTRADYEAEERGFGGPKAADSIRNVHGKYAPKKVGTIIYDTFDLAVHRSPELLDPIPGCRYRWASTAAAGRRWRSGSSCLTGGCAPCGRSCRNRISSPVRRALRPTASNCCSNLRIFAFRAHGAIRPTSKAPIASRASCRS